MERLCCTNFCLGSAITETHSGEPQYTTNPDLTPDVRHTASVLSLAKALRWIPSSIICRVSDKDELEMFSEEVRRVMEEENRKHEGTTPRSGGSTVMEPAWMTRLQADLINEDDEYVQKTCAM